MKKKRIQNIVAFLKKKHIYIRHDSQNTWILDRSLMEALLTVLMC